MAYTSIISSITGRLSLKTRPHHCRTRSVKYYSNCNQHNVIIHRCSSGGVRSWALLLYVRSDPSAAGATTHCITSRTDHTHTHRQATATAYNIRIHTYVYDDKHLFLLQSVQNTRRQTTKMSCETGGQGNQNTKTLNLEQNCVMLSLIQVKMFSKRSMIHYSRIDMILEN